jgi:prepilin-type N-terminal cleavage/methylation domain-containing protein
MFQKTIKESKISILSTIHSPLSTTHSAFTLVELLTVVVIISMLAGMSMLALTSTMTAAKESKTRGTIAKLDAAILDIYESYQERFENITIDDTRLATALGIAVASLTDQQRALARLHFISDIMRMEMPYQWSEILHNEISHGHIIPINTTGNSLNDYHILKQPSQPPQPPPVLEYYHNAHTSISTTNNTVPESSELLFLIIANLNPEALENFHGSEIGDIDGNGLREFHDAWGNPIQFIRWAPAFTGSDLQPDVVVTPEYPYQFGDTDHWDDSVQQNDTAWNVTTPYSLITNMRQALKYPDPFDPDGLINRTWFVYPLIVSGGADGSVDLAVEGQDASGDPIPFLTLLTTAEIPATISNTTISNIRILHPVKYPAGLPVEIDGKGTYDNIHNHRSSNSF